MKNTRILAVAATTLMGLGIVAPVMAATPNGDAVANGGQALPQTGKTDAGISFGNGGNTGNVGTLRLYRVPTTLDFGNHSLLDANFPNFDATGANMGLSSNKTHASYDMSDTNKTTLKTNENVVYTQVVDDQTTRVFNNGVDDSNGMKEEAGKYDNVAGSWTLSVKSEGAMTDNATGFKLTGTKLSLLNSNQKMYDTEAITGKAGSKAGTEPSYLNKAVVLDMDGSTEMKVQQAAATEGAGVSEARWSPNDVVLNVPGKENAKIQDGTYMGKLTWTLKSDI